MSERIIEIMGDLSDRLKIRVITPEYQIVLFLMDRSTATAEELLRNTPLSRTGFFNTLDRLRHWGILAYDKSTIDKRFKIYRLSDAVRHKIISAFQRYRASRSEFISLILRRAAIMEADDRLDQLSCEYQILLCLHLQPGLRNSDLLKLVDASDTKFNTSLSYLVKIGHVRYDHDFGDKRRKNYCVSDNAAKIIDDTHQRLLDWLATKEMEDLSPGSGPLPRLPHPSRAVRRDRPER